MHICMLVWIPGTDAYIMHMHVSIYGDIKIWLIFQSVISICCFLQFVEVMALRGHEEWIRSLDFAVDGISS